MKSLLDRHLMQKRCCADICRAGTSRAIWMIVGHDNLVGVKLSGLVQQSFWLDGNAGPVPRCGHIDPEAGPVCAEEQDKHLFERCGAEPLFEEAGKNGRDASIWYGAPSVCPACRCRLFARTVSSLLTQ